MKNIFEKKYMAIACVLFIATAATISLAGTTASQITACLDDNGNLRNVNLGTESAKKCNKNEQILTWNILGPQGPAGANGAVGPQGPAGANGADGAVGPQGPAGVNGAVGPQGPAGANGADGADGAVGPQGPAGVSGYEVVSTPMQKSGTFWYGTANCPGSKKVLGGGYRHNGYYPLQINQWLTVIDNGPYGQVNIDDNNAWLLQINDPNTIIDKMNVYAICANV